MNGIVKFHKTVKTVLLCLLALCLLSLLGCSKKQGQPGKPPPQTEPQPQKSPQQKATPAKTALKTDSNAAPARRRPADSNLTSKFRQALEKEVTRSLRDREKPAEANEGEPCELTLQQFGSLADSDEKIDFITDFSETHPELTVALADKALDDNDVDVRSAAMEVLIDNEVNKPEVLGIASRALKDSEEQIRQNAVEACALVNDPKVGGILVQALSDQSEDVRTAALQVAGQKDTPVRLEVLKAAITSSYEDVKTASVSALTDMSSPDAVDILITGLKDPTPEFNEQVKTALSLLLSQDFETYDQAKKWWDANRNKFDDELSEKDE
jgi:hypothetical protein